MNKDVKILPAWKEKKNQFRDIHYYYRFVGYKYFFRFNFGSKLLLDIKDILNSFTLQLKQQQIEKLFQLSVELELISSKKSDF